MTGSVRHPVSKYKVEIKAREMPHLHETSALHMSVHTVHKNMCTRVHHTEISKALLDIHTFRSFCFSKEP